MSWRDAPEKIEDSKILERYVADVVVVGLGYAGSSALRAAQEAGADTIGIEAMPRKSYITWGRDVGHINSSFLKSRGVPYVDPIDLFNEWMRRAGNRANPSLVMKYCQGCGSAFDWYTDMYGIEGMKDVHVAFWPGGGKFNEAARSGIYSLNGYCFWPGTAEFPDPMGWPGSPTLQDCARANLEKTEKTGARLFFAREAVQLVKDGSRVCGVIAKDKEENYYLYTARKAVILAAGDFAGNREMVMELCCDIPDIMSPGQKLMPSFGRRGRGIQMGLWAGGRLESRPLPTMGGNSITMFGPCGFGGIWLDPRGRRFCNEVFGGTELGGFAGNQGPRGQYYCVFDSHCIENELQWAFPAHGGFDANIPGNVDNLKKLISEAQDETVTSVKSFTPPPMKKEVTVYVGRTPEELAANAGFEGEIAANVVQSIKRYNALCAAGRDDDFGRDAKLLDPLTDTLFLHAVDALPNGQMLVTVGGFVTDEEQRVLDENYEVIEGLYASGNCCGRRFGTQYTTPISGVSIGMAITLGREAGTAAAGS